MGKVYVMSLGCDKNRVDGEVMVGNLRAAGYEVVDEAAQGAAIVVNTCGFIRDAVQESIGMVLELAAHKQNRCRALIIVGCMAQRYRREIEDAIPEADAIVGVGEYDKIARVVEGLIGSPVGSPQSWEDGAPGAVDPYLARLAARGDSAAPHIAYVKIAEGCDNRCAYCTIPAIRGPYRSRPMEAILEECRLLVAAGAKELVLVAQDTALYGADIYGEKKLPALLRGIAAESGAEWLRLMYAYPEHITPALVDAMAALPQVCKYIDMPVQHSEASVLSRMGRGGGRFELLSLIRVLRDRVPGIAIRTTLMVGFPGETAEDFRNLYEFVREAKFDRLGVFPYSREEGTPAAAMPRQVKDETKRRRLGRIMTLQRKIHFAGQRGCVGRTLPVMVDAADETGYVGRTRHDAYEVDSVVYFTSRQRLSPGQVVPVRVTAADNYDLRGIADLHGDCVPAPAR